MSNQDTTQGVSELTLAVQDSLNETLTGGLQRDINLNGHRITNVATPINSSDVATKGYVLANGGSGLESIVPLNEINHALKLNGDLNFLQTGDNQSNYRVLVENPTQNKHTANKQYVDTQDTALQTQITQNADDITVLSNRSLQSILNTNGSDLNFENSGYFVYVNDAVGSKEPVNLGQLTTTLTPIDNAITELKGRDLQDILNVNPSNLNFINSGFTVKLDNIGESETDQSKAVNIKYVDDWATTVNSRIDGLSLDIINFNTPLLSNLDFQTEGQNFKILAPEINMGSNKLILRDETLQDAPVLENLEPVSKRLLDEKVLDLQGQIDALETTGSTLTLQAIQNAQPGNLEMLGTNRLLLRTNINNESIENLPLENECIPYKFTFDKINSVEQLIIAEREARLSGDQFLAGITQSTITMADTIENDPNQIEKVTIVGTRSSNINDWALSNKTKFLVNSTDQQVKVENGDLNMDGNRIYGLEYPQDDDYATNKFYVDQQLANKQDVSSMGNYYDKTTADGKYATITSLNTEITNRTDADNLKMNASTTLNNIPVATSNVDINNNKLINISDATNNQDAVNLQTLNGALSAYYTTNEIDSRLDERDTAIATKRNIADSYSITQIDTALALKRDIANSYNKTQVNDFLLLKQDVSAMSSYSTTTQMNTALDLKRNIADSYSISQVDSALQNKMNVTSSLVSIQTAIPIEQNLNLGSHTIETTKSTFTDNELVPKSYVDANAGSGSSNKLPIGSILPFYGDGTNAPDGFLFCRGQTFDQSIYVDLYNFLGTNVLPNLQGLHIRGIDKTGLIDKDGIRSLGNVQQDGNKSHNHSYVDSTFLGGGGDPAWSNQNGCGNQDSDNKPRYRYNNGTTGNDPTLNKPSTDSSGNTEVTVKNMALNYIIVALANATGISTIGMGAISSNIDMQSLYKMTNLISGSSSSDSCTYGQLQSSISDLSSVYMPIGQRLDQITAPTTTVSMNSQRLINLANPTSAQDAITLLHGNNNYYQISQSVPRIRYDNTTSLIAQFPTASSFKISKQGLSTYYYLLSSSDHSLEQYQDIYMKYGYTSGATLKKLNDTAEYQTRPLWMSSSTSVNRDARLYVSRPTGATQSTLVTFVDAGIGGNYTDAGLFADCFAEFNRNVQFNSNVQMFNPLLLGNWLGGQPSQATLIVKQNNSTDNLSIETQGDIYCNSDIYSNNFIQIVPISERRVKKNINYIGEEMSDLINVKFCRYNYNKKAMEKLGYKRIESIDEEKQQFGVIVDEVPKRYRLKIKDDEFDDEDAKKQNLQTVNLHKLKDDCLAYLMERNRQLESRCQSLEAQLQSQKSDIDMLKRLVLGQIE